MGSNAVTGVWKKHSSPRFRCRRRVYGVCTLLRVIRRSLSSLDGVFVVVVRRGGVVVRGDGVVCVDALEVPMMWKVEDVDVDVEAAQISRRPDPESTHFIHRNNAKHFFGFVYITRRIM